MLVTVPFNVFLMLHLLSYWGQVYSYVHGLEAVGLGDRSSLGRDSLLEELSSCLVASVNTTFCTWIMGSVRERWSSLLFLKQWTTSIDYTVNEPDLINYFHSSNHTCKASYVGKCERNNANVICLPVSLIKFIEALLIIVDMLPMHMYC